MIIDLEKFMAAGRPSWTELEKILNSLENDPGARPDLAQLRHFHYLYERASADLAKIMTFSAEPELRRYIPDHFGFVCRRDATLGVVLHGATEYLLSVGHDVEIGRAHV